MIMAEIAVFVVIPARARRPAISARAAQKGTKRLDEFLLKPWHVQRVNERLQSLGMPPYVIHNESHGQPAVGSGFWKDAARFFARGHIVGILFVAAGVRLRSALQLRNEDLRLMWHMHSTAHCSDLCVVDIVDVASMGAFAASTDDELRSDHSSLLPMADRSCMQGLLCKRAKRHHKLLFKRTPVSGRNCTNFLHLSAKSLFNVVATVASTREVPSALSCLDSKMS